MSVRNQFKMMAESSTSQSTPIENLDKEGIEYWARLSRWNLIAAIKLSMGFNPNSNSMLSGKLMVKIPLGESENSKEYAKRLEITLLACEDNKLIVQEVPVRHTGFGGLAIDYEVDVKLFIGWARNNFTSNYEPLFNMALELYNNPYKGMVHAESGGHKGNETVEIMDLVREYAETALDEGCKCHHSELAEYLQYMERGDHSLVFKIPVYRNKPSIKLSRWPEHILKATVTAFRNKGIPLRTEAKTKPRGRALCKFHRGWAPPCNNPQK